MAYSGLYKLHVLDRGSGPKRYLEVEGRMYRVVSPFWRRGAAKEAGVPLPDGVAAPLASLNRASEATLMPIFRGFGIMMLVCGPFLIWNEREFWFNLIKNFFN